MEVFSIIECEQMINNASDVVLWQKFPSISLSSFWANLTYEYPEILKYAVRKLLPFQPPTFVNMDFHDKL